jgi:hypothetical protein
VRSSAGAVGGRVAAPRETGVGSPVAGLDDGR